MRVQTRLVKRYFVNGKGYATRLQAYKVLAREELLDTVFGAKIAYKSYDDILGTYSEYTQWYRPKFAIHDEYYGTCRDCYDYENTTLEDHNKKVFVLGMLAFGFVCDDSGEYSGWGEPAEYTGCCPEDFAFCGKKYKAWIASRAREMMEEDDAT